MLDAARSAYEKVEPEEDTNPELSIHRLAERRLAALESAAPKG